MKFLLKNLSLSYVRRNRAKTLLTLLGVVIGVATFSSIKMAQGTLIQGIRSTIDRVAGKAQLQITLVGGVPEEVQEKVRSLAGVKAVSPIIEQIIVPTRSELGSLLVVGVDLLGDREMRDYSFDGQDADLDDPLVFLAQPDSVLVTQQFAQKAGIKVGEQIALQAPHGTKRVAARGVMNPKGFAEAYGGNLMVMDVYAAQQLFGRGYRFDRLEVRLDDGVTIAQGTALLKNALGPAYTVETPGRRGAQMERVVANFVAGFNITSIFALGIGTFLIFNAFSVAVNRRRCDIGTLRALGATPRQVQILFLCEAVVIGLVGGAIGCLAGLQLSQGFLKMMGETTQTLYGVRGFGAMNLPPDVALQSLLLGMVASVAGAWKPALVASRISPTEAFAKGTFQARRPGKVLPRAVAGVLVFAATALLVTARPFQGGALVAAVLVLGVAAVSLLVTPLSRALLVALMPLVSRLAPVAGRLCANALLGNPLRTAGTLMAMTLSLSFVLGLGGYIGSSKASMNDWMDNVLTSDLFVRSSANLARPDFFFPSALGDELKAMPGVASVESYRAIRPQFRGNQILIASREMDRTMNRTRYDFLQGDEASMRSGFARGMCTVSDNFYRQYRLGVGQEVELATPTGVVRVPIAAVVRDYSCEQGTVIMDRSLFLRLWGDDRVELYEVSVAPGGNANQLRDLIRGKLAGKYPALVSTRKEFVAEIGKGIDAFYALMQITVLLALAVAFLGIVSSLLISVAERTREVGILKALGAVPSQISRGIVIEALLLSLVGLVLAIPFGNFYASFLEGTIAETYAGWRMPHSYPWQVLAQLLVSLPLISALAAWLPARRAAGLRVTESIEYE